jgi:hypothetical protein
MKDVCMSGGGMSIGPNQYFGLGRSGKQELLFKPDETLGALGAGGLNTAEISKAHRKRATADELGSGDAGQIYKSNQSAQSSLAMSQPSPGVGQRLNYSA